MEKIILKDIHPHGSGGTIEKTATELSDATLEFINDMVHDESIEIETECFKKDKIGTISKWYETEWGFEVVSTKYDSLSSFLEQNLVSDTDTVSLEEV